MPERIFGQFLRVDPQIKKKFLEPLIQDAHSDLYKRELGEVYLLAAVIGFKNKLSVPSNPSKESRDLRLYSTLSFRSKVLIDVIAWSESKDDFDSIMDGKEILSKIECYANGGAPVLFDKVFSRKDSLSLENEISDLFASLSKN